MKNRKNKGFTLAELLIALVVIAVLIAVSIPLLTGSLEKSKESSDIANMRNARVVLSTAYMMEEVKPGHINGYYYDGGKLSEKLPAEPYGKGTARDGKTTYSAGNGCEFCNYNSLEDHTSDYLVLSAGIDKVLHVHWAKGMLPVEKALPALDKDWVSWTVTDSRGLGGMSSRTQVLSALGLSDNHEYTFTTSKDDPDKYIVYVYNGNFPDGAKTTEGKKAVREFLNNEPSMDISVYTYTYNRVTKATEFVGQQAAKAVLRDKNGGVWIQIQPVK